MNTDGPTAGEKRVLLVDDERVVREMVGLLLGQIGYRVVEANNGAEALSLFIQGDFDLVMTDYEMPFLKGNDLATRIRRIAPCLPILMMTGFGHEASQDNPVDAVIHKPLNLAGLRTVMHQLLHGNEGTLEEPMLPELHQYI
jgi:DNA-binding response OmpR family regulator